MAALKKKKGMALTLTHSLSMSTNSTRLLPYLVLGGQESVSDMTTLSMLGVTHVLNVSNECKCWFEVELTYCVIPIHDEPEEAAAAHFDRAHEFIDGVRQRHVAGEKVVCMVHCKTGMSRSSTMVLNHLMRATGLPKFIAAYTSRTAMLQAAGGAADSATATATAADAVSRYSDGDDQRLTLRDALAYIRERRPRASPNPGFMQQLVELEVSLHGAPSIDVERYKKDRFGDVRTFCIGDVDPLAGYTGTAPLPAGTDDRYLFAGGGGAGGPDGRATPGEAGAHGSGVTMSSLTAGGGGACDPATSTAPPIAAPGASSDATIPIGSPQPLTSSVDAAVGEPAAGATAAGGGGAAAAAGEEGGWGSRAPPTRKAGEVKRKSMDFGFGEELDVPAAAAPATAAAATAVSASTTAAAEGDGSVGAGGIVTRPLPPVRDRRNSSGASGLFSPTAAGRSAGRSPAAGSSFPAAADGSPPPDADLGAINSAPVLPADDLAAVAVPASASRLGSLPDVQPPRGARRSNVSPAAVSATTPMHMEPSASPGSGSTGGGGGFSDAALAPSFTVTGESMRVQRTASTGSTDPDRRRISTDSHGGAATLPMPTMSSAAAAVSAARMELAAAGTGAGGDALDGIIAVGVSSGAAVGGGDVTGTPAPFMSPMAGRRSGGGAARRSPATTAAVSEEEGAVSGGGGMGMVTGVTGTPLAMSRSISATGAAGREVQVAVPSSAFPPPSASSASPSGHGGAASGPAARTISPVLTVGGTAIKQPVGSSARSAAPPGSIAGGGGGGDVLDMLGATGGSDGSSTALLLGGLSHRSGYTDSPSRMLPSPVSAYPLPGSIGYGTGAAVGSTPLPSLSTGVAAGAFPVGGVAAADPLPGTSKLSVLGAGLRPPSANPLSPGGTGSGPASAPSPLTVTSPQHGGLLVSGAGAMATPLGGGGGGVGAGGAVASSKGGRALAATGASVVAGVSSGATASGAQPAARSAAGTSGGAGGTATPVLAPLAGRSAGSSVVARGR